ncbi:hypothetical protein [Pseudanabaena mucicola]|uniref:PEP-CTERM sorting domain-containing protein n=1 Tax=Pseudanabaena mucicola FACHB-723 TaxID=2692860 RepID=A0ABR7ZS83_9CYAN|nr:hypothetical protein [Pseudanabaena mucicola]MBD2186629.1 hypothetical protein [Pseudanabaena mucicola FACHB-723]
MTTIPQKQGFLAASAIAAMAGVALSIPNAVSAANLATYDFEFKFANNTSGSGYITLDKDNKSYSESTDDYDYSLWGQAQWLDFSFAYLGTTYTKADVPSSYLQLYEFPTSSPFYPSNGSFLAGIQILANVGNEYKSFIGSASLSFNYGQIDNNLDTFGPFSLTERRPVPVPAFAFGIVAAGGWIASKQLRRQTKAVKQEVAV